jgi:hypothetical protein
MRWAQRRSQLARSAPFDARKASKNQPKTAALPPKTDASIRPCHVGPGPTSNMNIYRIFPAQ